jgi:hypothetical protein
MVTSPASARPSPGRIFDTLTAYQQSAALKVSLRNVPWQDTAPDDWRTRTLPVQIRTSRSDTARC